MKTIMEELINASVPIGSHYSDLYCEVNDKSRMIVNDYKFKCNVTTFINQIDNTQWFDIPFAFDTYWNQKLRVRP